MISLIFKLGYRLILLDSGLEQNYPVVCQRIAVVFCERYDLIHTHNYTLSSGEFWIGVLNMSCMRFPCQITYIVTFDLILPIFMCFDFIVFCLLVDNFGAPVWKIFRVIYCWYGVCLQWFDKQIAGQSSYSLVSLFAWSQRLQEARNQLN